jgi:hypothetical protein
VPIGEITEEGPYGNAAASGSVQHCPIISDPRAAPTTEADDVSINRLERRLYELEVENDHDFRQVNARITHLEDEIVKKDAERDLFKQHIEVLELEYAAQGQELRRLRDIVSRLGPHEGAAPPSLQATLHKCITPNCPYTCHPLGFEKHYKFGRRCCRDCKEWNGTRHGDRCLQTLFTPSPPIEPTPGTFASLQAPPIEAPQTPPRLEMLAATVDVRSSVVSCDACTASTCCSSKDEVRDHLGNVIMTSGADGGRWMRQQS